jgi:hypothetical protein
VGGAVFPVATKKDAPVEPGHDESGNEGWLFPLLTAGAQRAHEGLVLGD